MTIRFVTGASLETARVGAFACLAWILLAGTADAQLGQLVSPGPLAQAHRELEGAANCQKCHEPGRKVTADRCLSCHKPVAERIKARTGVHRDVRDDCVTCHVEHMGVDGVLRPFDERSFNHAVDAGYPLDGRHAAIAGDCAKCHKVRSFLAARTACASCHDDVHKGTLGSDCQRCHSVGEAFKDATRSFDHARAAFALAGAHQRVACAKCHVKGTYRGVKFAQCTDCHRNPHEQPFGATCLTCHTNDSWKTQKVDHAKTRFPLRGAHANLACARCHTKPPLEAAVRFGTCATCHTDPHKGSFKQDCSSCHTEVTFRKGTFDHATTRFALTGKHAPLSCVACHKNIAAAGTGAAGRSTVDFRGLKTDCVACHRDVHRNELGAKCEACHNAETFRVPAFTHAGTPEFYQGNHGSVACAACHVTRPPGSPMRSQAPVAEWTFKALTRTCVSCHADVHLGQVGTACEACHSIDAAKFAAPKFSHARSAFQLTGKHATVECRKCHRPETADFPAGRGTSVRLTGIRTTCVTCHEDRHAGQLGTSCEKCHTTSTFTVASYTHANPGTFFGGAHAKPACADCHKVEAGTATAGRPGVVRYKVGTTCTTCHQDPHGGAMSAACETCHSPDAWRTVSRGFHKVGLFPLEGRHLLVDCVACHWNGAYKGTPFRCVDCHWVRRQDDPYETRLGTACESCHRPVSWTAVRWNHATATGVPLSPVHQALGCDGCHKSRTFVPGSVTCYSCHAEEYQAAREPNHVQAGFPTACEACHRASHSSWSQAVFNHSSTFPLVGAHATQACAACHGNGTYLGTPRDCVGCHRADYDRTADPNHAAAGFPVTCDSCHRASDASWQTSFDHNQFFSLVGVHATQACAACHANNVYRGTPRDCIGCHRTDYDRTTSPNHAAAGFPTTCESCHRASDPGWQTGFDHNAIFPLVGVHATQACATCHANNVYKGTPRDCIGCHRTDYDRTTSPNHAAAGFPTTCESCHRASDASWQTAFNHNQFFPLVGVHATQACTACHANNVYKGAPRDCIGCHRADYDRTTNPNHAAAGFPTACDSCHSASSSTWSASFDHNQFYPLLGRHLNAACASCHVNNVYRGTPRECYPCHRTQYERTTSPNHQAAGFPTTCEACHRGSDTSWNQGRFDHIWFPITSGRHANIACAVCHADSNNYKVFSCLSGCHGRSSTDNEHRGVSGYRYDSAACYSCHPRGTER